MSDGEEGAPRALSREQILNAPDLVTETICVPEWGGTVNVRALTGAERDAFENSVVQGRGRNIQTNFRNMRAKLVALSVVDDEGKRLFSDSDAVDLGKKSAAALDRIFEVAQRLSGLRQEDVEELLGNSEAGQSDGFGSD